MVVFFILLQPLLWRCVECAVHHERNAREEQHIYTWREQTKIEWLRRGISADILSSMDVETTNPIHHLSLEVRLFVAVQSYRLIDMYGHRWDTDKWRCFLCSEQQVHAFGDDARLLRFYPALLAWRGYQQYKCLASPCDPLLIFPVGQGEYHASWVLPSDNPWNVFIVRQQIFGPLLIHHIAHIVTVGFPAFELHALSIWAGAQQWWPPSKGSGHGDGFLRGGLCPTSVV